MWEFAADGEDRFGIVLPQPIQDSGLGDLFRTSRYQKTLTSGTAVLLEIPAGWSGYLILMEKDLVGNIDLVSPSCLSVDPKLTGDVRLLPQHPKFPFFKPSTLGINLLWAGIFVELPDWDWLANVPSNGLLSLQSEHLLDLWNYASQPPQGSQIWRSSYVVVR